MSWHWAIPLLRATLPWVLEKVFDRDETKAARLLGHLDDLIEWAEAAGASTGLTGDAKRELVWTKLEAAFPRQVARMDGPTRRALNDLVVERLRNVSKADTVAAPEPTQADVAALVAAVQQLNHTVNEAACQLRDICVVLRRSS